MVVDVFFVFILVGGIYVSKVGPFFDYTSCSILETVIDHDIERSMKKDFPFGMVHDKWGIGNGAIYRFNDYSVFCGIEHITLKN